MANAGAQTFRYFRARGLSPAQAAGIVGNAQQESGLNPASAGGGLFQYIGDRAPSGRGGLRQQLDATWRELAGPQRQTLNALRGATTPQQAALIFSRLFERPGVPQNQNRERYATEALRNYGHLPPGMPAGAPTGTEGGEGSRTVPGTLSTSTAVSQGAGDPQALRELLEAVKPSAQAIGHAALPSFAAGPTLPQETAQPLGSPPEDPAKLTQLVERAIGSPNVESKVQSTGPQTLPQASPQSSAKLAGILAEANHISQANVPYLWGGGHGGKVLPGGKVTPLDCSGAVSAALGIDPKVSGQFEGWGSPGKGQHVTVYANQSHVLLEIDGKLWGTSGSRPGGGAGWIRPGVVPKSYLARFVARHPAGL